MTPNTAPLVKGRIASTAADPTWTRRRNVAFTIVCWLFLAGVTLWAAAHVIHAVLVLVVSGLLAYALAPLVARLARWMPRWLALVLVYLGLLALVGALGYVLVNAAITEVTRLVDQVRQVVATGPDGAPSPLDQFMQQLGLSQTQINDIRQQVLTQTQRLAGDIIPVLQGVFNGVLDVVLVLVLSIYLLIDGARAYAWARTGAPLRFRPRVVSFLGTLEGVVGGYIRGQLALAALLGVLVGVGMYAFGLPYALLLGALAFVLEFIPVIGTLVSGAICVLIALTYGWLLALGVLAYFVVVHVIEGYVIGPRLVGHAVGLHPTISIVALIAGSQLFGIWGALFAAPLAGLIQAVLLGLWIEWRTAHPDEFPIATRATPFPPEATAAADALTGSASAAYYPKRDAGEEADAVHNGLR